MWFGLVLLCCVSVIRDVWASPISIEPALRTSTGPPGTCSSLYGTHEYMLFAHRRTSLPMANENGYDDENQNQFEDRIVLALHMSKNRGDELKRWCQTWSGPISVALFDDSLEKARKEMELLLNDTCIKEHADIHLTWCVAAPIQQVPETAAMKLLQSIQSRVGHLRRNHRPEGICGKYPFNLQRNVAVEGAELRWTSAKSDSTSSTKRREGKETTFRSANGLWHLLVDIDLILLPDSASSSATVSTHFKLLRKLSKEHVLNKLGKGAPLSDNEIDQLHQKRIWTIPAMEYPRGRSTFQHAIQHPGLLKDNNKCPSTASELVDSIRTGQVRPFYVSCAQCYGMINISRFAAISVEFERVLSSCRAMKRRSDVGKGSPDCSTAAPGRGCAEDPNSNQGEEQEIVRCVAANRPSPVSAEWSYPYPYKDGTEPFGIIWKAATPVFSDLLIGRNLDKISMHFQFYYSAGFSYVALPGVFLINMGIGDDPGQKTEDEVNFELQNSIAYWNVKHLELQRRLGAGLPPFWGGFQQNLEGFLEGPGINPMWPLEFGGTWLPEYRRDFYSSTDTPDQLVQFSRRSARMNGFAATHVRSYLATFLDEVWRRLLPYDRLFPLRCVTNDDSGVDAPYDENIRMISEWCSTLNPHAFILPIAEVGNSRESTMVHRGSGQHSALLAECPALKASPFVGLLPEALKTGGRLLTYAEDSFLQHVWQIQFRNASVASHAACTNFGQRSGDAKRGRVIVVPQRCMACIPGPGLDQRLQASLLADLCSSAKLGQLCDLWGPRQRQNPESYPFFEALAFAMTLYMQLEFPHQSEAFSFQLFDFCARGIGGLVVPFVSSSLISPLYTQLVACDEVGYV